ncbi:HET-domain-containing protein [Paraphaeosphaeria sporulosa]|uniref:HET-domain-containing protein n=1 Tax=Paraphaeosphaeria sporulosa TaxID=1460663 RepID=A0A177C873_9PLEO|nr:HET-domain-containing protein [Paraphaeosphaeria sporulosa]OAG03606.1 HET-domain-containing protein [Paraphaeosphaeria sporulosa]
MAVNSIYKPLAAKAQTIRLLRLLPNAFKRDIECELLERPISEAQNCYIAISYTWGSAGATKQVLIHCNGVRVSVSENLFTILRRLRHPLRNANVWVDALCINQADPIERTQQVGLMGDIYRNSRETVIWLGEPTAQDEDGRRFSHNCCGPLRLVWHGDAADDHILNQYLDDCLHDDLSSADVPHDVFGAFCLVSSLASGNSSRLFNMLKNDESRLCLRYAHNQRLYDFLPGDVQITGSRASRVFAGLARIMSRPWWTRIWVIQETVLSQKAVVHFGQLSAPWTMFAKAATRFAQDRQKLCLDLSGAFWGQSTLTTFSNTVLRFDIARQHSRAWLDIDLLSLLWRFRPLESTDKRDKIFALLGLVTDWQNEPPMLPDYQMDVSTTFVRTAASTIQRTKSLTVLAGDLGAILNRKRVEHLATWVMDWSLPCLPVEIDRVCSLGMYNASGGHSSPVRLHLQHSILEASGWYVDYVIAVGDVSRHTQISEALAAIRSWHFETKRHEELHSSYPTGCTYDEAFWRTLIADIVHSPSSGDLGHMWRKNNDTASYRRATREDFEAYRSWRMWSRCIARDTLSRTATFTQGDLDDGISSIHYAFKTATTSRRFFITSKGYIGFGPRTTQLGHEVWILSNSKVPFLLSATHTPAQLPHLGRSHNIKKCTASPLTTLVRPDGRDSRDAMCNKPHGCRTMAGDCFVYGLMDGEYMAASVDSSIEQVFLV